MRFLKAFAAVIVMAGAAGVRADSVTFTVAPSNTGDGSSHLFSAYATIAVNPAGTMNVQIFNTTVSPRSANEDINGLLFTFKNATPPIGSPSLSSSSSILRTIDTSTGKYTDTGPTSTDWVIDSPLSSQLGINSSKPDQLVVGLPDTGTNLYSSANSSIGQENPLLFNPTFVLSVSNLASVSQIASVQFYYGTSNGNIGSTEGQISGGGSPPPSTPLPATASAGFGLLGLFGGFAVLRNRRQLTVSE